MKTYKITFQEIQLALLFLVLGFFFSSAGFLRWLNTLNAYQGFTVYEGILVLAVWILSKMGFTIFSIPVKKLSQVIGVALIMFSFFVIFNWESPWVQYVTEGHITGASNVYTNNSEDGVLWYFWTNDIGITDPSQARMYTFIISPFLLTLIGGFLVSRPKLNLL